MKAEDENVAIGRKLFDAFASGDLDTARALCAEGFRGQQNGGKAMDVASLLRFTAAVRAAVPDFRYEDALCEPTPTGFVEEHVVRGTLPDGSALAIHACVVGEVQGGRITALREYLDSGAAAGLIAALSPG
ncbi:nuclear transport factor 2 family protein [Qipengyuania nanhaisediminis]|uniref:nuclear transport factor 2 family protein n=1 Tax=Qipengyuania nanhaisediminis TaxID=604088 RepID=UPI0038B2B8EA